jgi:fatty acid desaturase
MEREIVLTDPVYAKPARYGRFDRFLLKFIVDERDLVFLHLMLRIAIVIVPIAVYLFLPGRFSWWIAVPYLALNWVVFLGPYILMLHCACHRRLFKREYEWMNKIIPWVLGPFFGETPETYFGHHLGMHHPENNLDDDLSCTMRYQRDSFLHFLAYFFRFFLLIVPELSIYFTRKGRGKLLRKTLLGEFSWYLLVIALAFYNFEATLAVFIIPFVFARFMMMAGNWGQHAFIDASDAGNCYRNSITCINVAYNRKCFNDGYHIIHHLEPSLHYTDMPGEFLANLDHYARQKAIVFEGLDFFMIWFLLMVKAYKLLARKLVRLDDAMRSEDEVIAFLKSRTARIVL